jgi:hypothetical protein
MQLLSDVAFYCSGQLTYFLVINYREKVATLEKKVQSLTDENENLLAQMERRDMQASRKTSTQMLFKQN